MLDAEERGWRIEKGAKHFRAFCPCVDKHMTTISATPSASSLDKVRKQLNQCNGSV